VRPRYLVRVIDMGRPSKTQERYKRQALANLHGRNESAQPTADLAETEHQFTLTAPSHPATYAQVLSSHLGSHATPGTPQARKQARQQQASGESPEKKLPCPGPAMTQEQPRAGRGMYNLDQDTAARKPRVMFVIEA
jgi:hypothetical protein